MSKLLCEKVQLLGFARQLLVERSRDEKLMYICTPRLEESRKNRRIEKLRNGRMK